MYIGNTLHGYEYTDVYNTVRILAWYYALGRFSLVWNLFDTLRLTEVVGRSFLMIQSQRLTAEVADDAPPWPEDDDDDPERLTPADGKKPPK